ncbi:MAG: rod shape-determining protein [Archaeoglobaceae archaeon]
MIVGLDVGTNYTKITDGERFLVYPSIVAYGEEREWSLKGASKNVYVGEEALAIIRSVENAEVIRPIHEGRVIHESYVELAKHGIEKLGVRARHVATGMPVKSSKREREEVKEKLASSLGCEVLVFPQPAGTMAAMGIETGVCIDVGFGTTDVLVLSDMEFLRGDTMLLGVDKLYEALETLVRNRSGISLTPEEVTSLLVEGKKVGRIRSGKRVEVSFDDIAGEYERLVASWVDRIAGRVKAVLEGLSTLLLENFVITGGGSMLPKVYELFCEAFSDVGEVKRPEDPIKSNAIGFYEMAKKLVGETVEESEEDKDEKRSEGKRVRRK